VSCLMDLLERAAQRKAAKGDSTDAGSPTADDNKQAVKGMDDDQAAGWSFATVKAAKAAQSSSPPQEYDDGPVGTMKRRGSGVMGTLKVRDDDGKVDGDSEPSSPRSPKSPPPVKFAMKDGILPAIEAFGDEHDKLKTQLDALKGVFDQMEKIEKGSAAEIVYATYKSLRKQARKARGDDGSDSETEHVIDETRSALKA